LTPLSSTENAKSHANEPDVKAFLFEFQSIKRQFLSAPPMPTRIVYRADTRDHHVTFVGGFAPRMAGGIQIQKGGQMIGGVSTSKDVRVAVRYAGLYDGYVYAMVVEDGPDAVDVHEAVKKMGGNAGALKNCRTQLEVACSGIAGASIIGARRARLNGTTCELFGPTHLNANCTENASLKQMGSMALDAAVTVSKDYDG
jgi:hypothetical protein